MVVFYSNSNVQKFFYSLKNNKKKKSYEALKLSLSPAFHYKKSQCLTSETWLFPR